MLSLRSTYMKHLCLIGSMLWASLFLTQAGAEQFSSAETRRLQAGSLVIREKTDRRGSAEYFGGTSWQMSNASSLQLWQQLTTTTCLSHIMPGADQVRVIQNRGNIKIIRVTHRNGPLVVQYHLKLRFDARAQKVIFTLDNNFSNDITAVWGYLQLHPQGQQTLISWGIMTNTGNGIFAGAMKSQIQSWMLRVPSTFKSYAERIAHPRPSTQFARR